MQLFMECVTPGVVKLWLPSRWTVRCQWRPSVCTIGTIESNGEYSKMKINTLFFLRFFVFHLNILRSLAAAINMKLHLSPTHLKRPIAQRNQRLRTNLPHHRTRKPQFSNLNWKALKWVTMTKIFIYFQVEEKQSHIKLSTFYLFLFKAIQATCPKHQRLYTAWRS